MPKLINRTAEVDRIWKLDAYKAAFFAGLVGALPIFLYPRDVFYGIEELLWIALFGIPSLVGVYLGRPWVPNLVTSIALAILFPSTSTLIIALCSGVLAGGTLAWLMDLWDLVHPRSHYDARTVPLPFLLRIGRSLLLVGAVCLVIPAMDCGSLKRSAKSTTCLSNVKQDTLALLMYTESNECRLPEASSWMDVTEPLVVKNAWALHCPNAMDATPLRRLDPRTGGLRTSPEQPYGYSFNRLLSRRSPGAINNPANMPLIHESANLSRNANDDLLDLPNPPRHEHSWIVSYADGHARKIRAP